MEAVFQTMRLLCRSEAFDMDEILDCAMRPEEGIESVRERRAKALHTRLMQLLHENNVQECVEMVRAGVIRDSRHPAYITTALERCGIPKRSLDAAARVMVGVRDRKTHGRMVCALSSRGVVPAHNARIAFDACRMVSQR